MCKNAVLKLFQVLTSCVLDTQVWIPLSGTACPLLIPLLIKNLYHPNAASSEPYSGKLKVLCVFTLHVTELGIETYVQLPATCALTEPSPGM